MFKNVNTNHMPKGIYMAAIVAVLLVAVSLVLAACSAAGADPVASGETKAGQPEFKVVGLGVNPSQVNPGEKVYVVANIVNSGNADGVYNAQLKVNGLVEAVGDVSIPAGGSREVKFSMSKDSVQEYTVNLGEMNGKFSVVAPQSQGTALAGVDIPAGQPSCCQTPAATGVTSSAIPAAGSSCCGGGGQSIATQSRSCCGY